MRRLLAIFTATSLLGCGAHLHHPVDHQLASGAAERVSALDWGQAFARDREFRDGLAEREAEIGRAYADARREAELLDILTEPIGERSWAKLEDRLIALGSCMLDAPGTGGGRACRGRVSDARREAVRSMLFEPCPTEGCAWVEAIVELGVVSTALADQLAAFDRARNFAGLGDEVASAAQCPVPTRLPARLRDEGQALEQACAAYDRALAAVAELLPEASGLRSTIGDYRVLAAARDDYRRALRLLSADLGSLRFDGRVDPRELDQQLAEYLALQAEYVLALADAKLGDFGDLALEGILLISREHRAALVRSLAVLNAVGGEIAIPKLDPADRPVADKFRSGGAGPAPQDPSEPERPREPSEPTPPRPAPSEDPVPTEDPRQPSDPTPPRPALERPAPVDPEPESAEPPARRAEPSVDTQLLRSLGPTLAPVFGETWATIGEQRRASERGSLLLSAEIERIQIAAMSRRLAHADERLWLELAQIETQLLTLLRLRGGIAGDWIPADRPASPERDAFDRLALEREIAGATLTRARAQLSEALAKLDDPPSKGTAARERVEAARQRVRETEAALDRADDAYHEHLHRHGAGLCVRRGGVSQTYEREPACAQPIERLVGLHAELVGVSLPRLESLDRAGARRRDEAALLRDQAGLEIRVTYIAASVAALQRFTAGGLEPRDVAAIVGAVVGIGLGAAITTGVYLP